LLNETLIKILSLRGAQRRGNPTDTQIASLHFVSFAITYKKNMKKILFGLAAFALVIATVPMFAAFEAHVINVTATIENALQVTPSEISFGTTFPQERLDKTFEVSISNSFREEGRVDDVTYIIRQKPKCVLVATGTQLPQYGLVTEIEGNFVCVDDVNYDILPLLCPYLSKHEITTDSPENDSAGINAFHGLPGPWTLQTTIATQVAGKLVKSTGDVSDIWNIDLKVPCFKGSCAQDWAAFVHEQNPLADPVAYMADPLLEHQLFGCDLWLEVNGVSVAGSTEPERPTVGAANFVAGTPTCNITIDDSFGEDTAITFNNIQEGIDAAETGQTVCVAEGNYNQFTVNKALTVRGLNDPEGGSAAIVKPSSSAVGALALVTASNVTITGIQFDGAGFTIADQASGIQISPVDASLSNVNITYNVIKNIATASGFAAKGIQWFTDTNSGFQLSNSNFKHNTISNISAVTKGGYGVQTVGAMSNVAIENNTISNTTGAWGAGVAVDTKNTTLTVMSGDSIAFNQIMTNVSDSISRFGVQIENSIAGSGIAVNQNNLETLLYGGGNTNFGTEGTLNAQNNWWGTIAPTLGVDVFEVPITNDVDFTPSEVVAFPQN